MTAYVALLRGINVGKGNRLPMADLRALLSELGYTDVATLLNSGNAVFKAARGPSAKLGAQIADAIEARLGLRIAVVVKSAQEWQAVVEGNPLAIAAPDHSRLFAICAQDVAALQGLTHLVPLLVEPEAFHIGSHAAYLHCAGGVLESKAGAALMSKGGPTVTTRNWATTLKLQGLLQARAS